MAGLLLSGVIILAACLGWILFGRKASVLFTPSHRDVVDRTPYLDPRRPFGFDRASKRTLRLKLRAVDGRLSRVAFRFPTTKECRQWAGRLAALIGPAADPALPAGDSATAEPTLVVLLRQRPTARYQMLGTVEGKAAKRRMAEAGLLVRAAIIGGDAVVDLQEEFLPEFGRTVRRLTGTAVRAVDAESSYEFRSRWYADQVARISGWALVLLLISLLLTVLSSIFFNAIEQARLGIMTSDAPVELPTQQAAASTLLQLVLWTVLIIAATHAWPIGLAALTRVLHWPQFVRPLALSLAAFPPFARLYLLTGLVAGALVSGGWAGLIYHSWGLLDPMNLAILVFGLFLGRAAWRADREFCRLVPDVGRQIPLHRSLVGGSTVAVSVTYVVVLACYITWAAYLGASQFRLPTAINRKAAAAMAQFQAGAAIQKLDRSRSEAHFRRALPLWEELVREVPSEPEYRINLELTRTVLGFSASAQGRHAEGREQLMRSAGEWEAIASGPLPASKRAIVDRNRALIRSVLPSIEAAVSMMQGGALHKAGDDAGAEAAYRRALKALGASPGGPGPSPFSTRPVRGKSYAEACNALSWLLSAKPGRGPERAGEAMALAELAVGLDPENGNIWNTLSLARFRTGDWPRASAALDRSMSLRGGGDSNDWVVLAMIRWRQGERAEAHRWLDKATAEIERLDQPDDDLRRLRDEAAALLGKSPSR